MFRIIAFRKIKSWIQEEEYNRIMSECQESLQLKGRCDDDDLEDTVRGIEHLTSSEKASRRIKQKIKLSDFVLNHQFSIEKRDKFAERITLLSQRARERALRRAQSDANYVQRNVIADNLEPS